MGVMRIAVLLRKELFQGPKNFFFIGAIIMPLILSFAISLVFGTLFNDQASLGIVDEGNSQLVMMIEENSALVSTEYKNVDELTDAVRNGAVDGGLVLIPDFDEMVKQGEQVDIPLYMWGESLAKDRSIILATVSNLVRELANQEVPIDIETITLGEEENIPWNDRLLPLIVLMAVALAGLALAGSSLVAEKEKKTIDAVVVTPTTINQVFIAKGLLGIIIGVISGIIILLINQAFVTNPALLVMLLILGGIMAAGIGLLMGAFSQNVTTFFSGMKLFGALLYAPAIFYFFPDMPQWIGKIFPTYYIVQPIVEISQQNAGWSQISFEVFILIGLDVALITLVAMIIRKKPQYAV